MSREIIQQLVKIAEKQQKILNKLAQGLSEVPTPKNSSEMEDFISSPDQGDITKIADSIIPVINDIRSKIAHLPNAKEINAWLDRAASMTKSYMNEYQANPTSDNAKRFNPAMLHILNKVNEVKQKYAP